VTIGYSLDTQDTFLGETFDRFRVYLTAINLATLTDYLGYNPEVSNNTTSSLTPGEDYGTYPLTTSLTLGFNLNF
jgi:hypothetical protein